MTSALLHQLPFSATLVSALAISLVLEGCPQSDQLFTSLDISSEFYVPPC
jgi:hypothetical protein